MSVSAEADGTTAAVARADMLVAEGHLLEAIETLHEANRLAPDPDVEVQLATLRHQAFALIEPASRFTSWPPPTELPDSAPATIPVISPGDLTAERVRRAILTHGCVRVPNLLANEQAAQFVHDIEHTIQVRTENEHRPLVLQPPWFAALPLPPEQAELLFRPWIARGGGLLACDSPRLLEQIFTIYEDLGLRDLLTEYLGERPILSANKCTLRRAGSTNASWHQDGAFLGTDLRVLNVWISLSDCGGDRDDAPSMDVVPRRLDHVVETGTGGAIFDWAVGDDVVESLSVDHPVIRTSFNAGDALLFDEFFLHRTAVGDHFTRDRYAIESWFFAATGYPAGQIPLVW
jgi:hypothetical protein